MDCNSCENTKDCEVKTGGSGSIALFLPHPTSVEEIIKKFDKGIKEEKVQALITEGKITYYNPRGTKDYYRILIEFDFKEEIHAYSGKILMHDIESKEDKYDKIMLEVKCLDNSCPIDIVTNIIKKYFKKK